MRRESSSTFSIFGQIEAVAAETMLQQGKGVRIPADQVPASVATNERGDKVRFAVRFTARSQTREFEQLCRDLRM